MLQHVHALQMLSTSCVDVVGVEQIVFSGQRVGATPMPTYTWPKIDIDGDAYGTSDPTEITTQSLSAFPIQAPENIIFSVISWGVTQRYSYVSGSVIIDGEPEIRSVMALSVSARQIVAQAVSSLMGAFDLKWQGDTGNVICIMLDDLGKVWSPDTMYQHGSVIYPITWSGWQYECINPGIGPSDEPTWWAGEGVTATIGSATFKARQYIPAMAHGPVKPIAKDL